MMKRNTTCPRCGGGVPNDHTPGAYPGALSRYDNETEICSDCGVKEAMFQFINHENRYNRKQLPDLDTEIMDDMTVRDHSGGR